MILGKALPEFSTFDQEHITSPLPGLPTGKEVFFQTFYIGIFVYIIITNIQIRTTKHQKITTLCAVV